MTDDNEPLLDPQEFENLRRELSEARSASEAARRELFLGRERLKQLDDRLAQLARASSPGRQDLRSERDRLVRQRGELAARLKGQEAAYSRSKGAALELARGFSSFSDPRRGAELLSDETPVLLFPVRIETRFKTLGAGDAERFQLWVRIYPDDCVIDTFEPLLSEAEVRSARQFWIDRWRAGGHRTGELGAWGGLAAAHGSGRAYYIQQVYRPLNEPDLPTKTDPQDIILVIPLEEPLPAAELPAVGAYWQAVWKAGEDRQAVEDAYAELVAGLGSARAAEIDAGFRPANLAENPPLPYARQDVSVSTAVIVFTPEAQVETKRSSWSQPARVKVFPERFVLVGYRAGVKVLEEVGAPLPSPLIVGPDPSGLDPAAEMRADGGELTFGDEVAWMVDFDAAVKVGLGFRIDLTREDYTQGFDLLFALGLRLSAGPEEGRELVETLLSHHQRSRGGFSLLPQGAPTNNSGRSGSAYTGQDDPQAAYADFFERGDLFEETEDWLLKPDGQWLAELLGIHPGALKKVRYSDGRDGIEARAMNTALWPATLGYWMDSQMAPLFSSQTIEQTRWFFTRFASGRGMLPAVRIGRQPYGILPTTAYSRQDWRSAGRRPIRGLEPPTGFPGFLQDLYGLIERLKAAFPWLYYQAKSLESRGDSHKLLLELLGLHPASVEFYQQVEESLDHLYNLLRLQGARRGELDALRPAASLDEAVNLLRSLGYAGDELPDILEKFFAGEPNRLNGPLIDDRPLSETSGIREYTPDGRNYIQWLADAARLSLEMLRRQEGFTGDQPPDALLYLMLRHALLLGYEAAGWEAYRRRDMDAPLARLNREAKSIHLVEPAAGQEVPPANESRWALLYTPDERLTGRPGRTVGEFITGQLEEPGAAGDLDEQVAALGNLADAPTARLERLFAEHIDLCSYRLDAWDQALLHYRLASLRYSGERPARGIYLGAFGCLEAVRPESRSLSPVELSGELKEIFQPEGAASPLTDSSNAGFLHAPSLNQAVTAAILRSGHLVSGKGETLAVELSSARLRPALALLEGIRSGQSLGALLGYQLERGLHDNGPVGIEAFIYPLRRLFPLAAGHLAGTHTPESESAPIEALDARNVVDGYALLQHIRRSGNSVYPFGLDLPRSNAGHEPAINAQVSALFDLYDAASDLMLAESVHQVALGNYDRSAAALDAFAKAGFPPETVVIQTPRSGLGLTHRVALHLQPGLDPASSPHAGLAVTPRARAEPALNAWLASVLPLPEDVALRVDYEDAVGAQKQAFPTQADLGLQPIDLLYMLAEPEGAGMGALDDRITRYVESVLHPRPAAPVTLSYMERPEGDFSFFELSAVLRSLRSLLLRARPLRPDDLALSDGAGETPPSGQVFPDTGRLLPIHGLLDERRLDLVLFQGSLASMLDDLPAQRENLLEDVDIYLQEFAGHLSGLSLFGLPQAGYGFVYAWRHGWFTRVQERVGALVERWRSRMARYTALLDELAGLDPGEPDETRYNLLRQAEDLVSTARTEPLPSSPADYLAVVGAKQDLFAAKLVQLEDLLDSAAVTVTARRAEVLAVLPLDAFDAGGLDLAEPEAEALRFLQDLEARAGALVADLQARLDAAEGLIVAAESQADPAARLETLLQAGRKLLSDEFLLIPEFSLAPDAGSELENSYNAAASLLDYQENTLGADFPVDDWLSGAARVREKLAHLENIQFLAEAFGRTVPELRPLQLPYRAGEAWLALDFPEETLLEGERLLYTAHWAAPYDPAGRMAGLLLDEWTETIPAREQTTGLTFHFDRPNTEPPQVFLLAVPPAFTGRWSWQDLVDTLVETLAQARLRLVEPSFYEHTALARLLPTTVSGSTLRPLTINLNLAQNNRLLKFIPGGEHG